MEQSCAVLHSGNQRNTFLKWRGLKDLVLTSDCLTPFFCWVYNGKHTFYSKSHQCGGGNTAALCLTVTVKNSTCCSMSVWNAGDLLALLSQLFWKLCTINQVTTHYSYFHAILVYWFLSVILFRQVLPDELWVNYFGDCDSSCSLLGQILNVLAVWDHYQHVSHEPVFIMVHWDSLRVYMLWM